MVSALGCVMAIRARELTGRGQFCETSLLQAAMALQAGEFIFYEGRPDMEGGHAEYRGRSALSRAYPCRDGRWLFISLGSPGEWAAAQSEFPSVPQLSWEAASREPNEGRLATVLESEFARLDRQEALTKLRACGIPAAPIHHFGDLFEDPQVAANELIAELNHSQWSGVRQTGVLTKFSGTQATISRAAPLLGEHTEQILREYLGYDDRKIANLSEKHIVKQAE